MKWTHVSNPFETLNGTRGIADLCIVVAIVCTRRSRSCLPVDFWIEWEKRMLTQWSLSSCLVLTSVIKVLAGCRLAVRLVSFGPGGNTSRGNKLQGTGTIRQKRHKHTHKCCSDRLDYAMVDLHYLHKLFDAVHISPCPVCRALYVWEWFVPRAWTSLTRLNFSNKTKARPAGFYFYFFVVLFKRQIHVRTTNHFIRLCLSRLAHINACAALKPVEHFGGQHFD